MEGTGGCRKLRFAGKKASAAELRIELAGYADDYRKGVIEKIAALKK
jgi:hypothetical protein